MKITSKVRMKAMTKDNQQGSKFVAKDLVNVELRITWQLTCHLGHGAHSALPGRQSATHTTNRLKDQEQSRSSQSIMRAWVQVNMRTRATIIHC